MLVNFATLVVPPLPEGEVTILSVKTIGFTVSFTGVLVTEIGLLVEVSMALGLVITTQIKEPLSLLAVGDMEK